MENKHQGNHHHTHSIECGHTKVRHHDHIDYIHDNHLHHEHNGHWDDCKIEVSEINPDTCQPLNCGCDHQSDCGHEMIPHGDHYDYLINGRLHHMHDDHCDDHGPLEIVYVR